MGWGRYVNKCNGGQRGGAGAMMEAGSLRGGVSNRWALSQIQPISVF